MLKIPCCYYSYNNSMEFLTFIAVCVLIYLVYLIRQDFKDHSVRIESQMQRVTEVVIKNQEKQE